MEVYNKYTQKEKIQFYEAIGRQYIANLNDILLKPQHL